MKPEYLAGFFDGEGSLILRIRKDPRYKSGFQIKPHIDITQKDPKVLRKIQKEMDMGKLYQNSSDGIWHLCVYKTDDIVNFLKIVDEHVIVKKDKVKRLLRCMRIFQNKEHLSSKGFAKLKMLWFARDSEANTP